MIGRTSTIAALAMIGIAVGLSGSEPVRSEPPRGPIVFYLTGLSSTEGMCVTGGCAWRTFDPRTEEDLLFLALSKPPSYAFWNIGFEALHYLQDGALYRVVWRYGATPQRILELPRILDLPHERVMEVWHDDESDVWSLATLSYSSDGIEMAHAWEQSAADKSWKRTRSAPTDCEKPGAPCMQEVSAPSQWNDRVSLKQIQDKMRIWTHLIRTGQDSGNEKLYDLRSRSVPASTVRVRMSIGDSAHAIPPLSLVLASSEEHVIELGADCLPQLAFDDVDGFLLLGTEYDGECSKLVDLRTGHIVRSLPERSRDAVWVPPPRPDGTHTKSR